MDGFVSLLKPPGMTSSDAVLFIRKLLPRGVKTGHCGTLDPDAAGVLVVSVGKATRLFDYVIDGEKHYIATVTFGASTDTQDATGRVTESSDREVAPDEVIKNLPALTGRIMQTPPMFSAIKRDGKRLYESARQGKTVDVEPREVEVSGIDYLGRLDKNRYMIKVACHKGVYIRTLCDELGRLIGCPAHMSFLLRTKVGSFSIDKAMTLEELSSLASLESAMTEIDAPLGYLPEVRLPESLRRTVKCGNSFILRQSSNKSGLYRVYVSDSFAGLSVCDDEGRHAFKCMLLTDA